VKTRISIKVEHIVPATGVVEGELQTSLTVNPMHLNDELHDFLKATLFASGFPMSMVNDFFGEDNDDG